MPSKSSIGLIAVPANGLRKLKLKPAMARRCSALAGVGITLQDCLNPRVMAAGAKVVDWLHAVSGAENYRTQGRFKQFVTRKLVIAAFHLDYLVAQFNGLLTQHYIFLSRLHYLFAQIGEGRADLLHWCRLRRLKQRLQSLKRTYNRVYRNGPVLGDYERLIRGVHIEIHDIASCSRRLAEERKSTRCQWEIESVRESNP